MHQAFRRPLTHARTHAHTHTHTHSHKHQPVRPPINQPTCLPSPRLQAPPPPFPRLFPPCSLHALHHPLHSPPLLPTASSPIPVVPPTSRPPPSPLLPSAAPPPPVCTAKLPRQSASLSHSESVRVILSQSHLHAAQGRPCLSESVRECSSSSQSESESVRV